VITINRDEIIAIIRAHKDRLGELGVASLALFGSAARDEARGDSDVDVLVEFEGRASFDRYMDLKLLLEDLLERRVDLVTRRAFRAEVRSAVESDLLQVT